MHLCLLLMLCCWAQWKHLLLMFSLSITVTSCTLYNVQGLESAAVSGRWLSGIGFWVLSVFSDQKLSVCPCVCVCVCVPLIEFCVFCSYLCLCVSFWINSDAAWLANTNDCFHGELTWNTVMVMAAAARTSQEPILSRRRCQLPEISVTSLWLSSPVPFISNEGEILWKEMREWERVPVIDGEKGKTETA